MKKIFTIAVVLLIGLPSFAQDSIKAEFSVLDVCDGNETVFTNTTKVPTKFGNCDYFWTFGDGTTSTSQFPKHTYTLDDVTKSQVFLIKLVVRSKAIPTEVDSTEGTTTIFPNPNPYFTWKVNNKGNTQEVTIDSQATKNSSYLYQWTLANVLKSNDVTPVFKHDDVKDYLDGSNHNFTLYLRSDHGCEATYTTTFNYNPLSVHDVVVDQGLAYPNPSTGTIYLKHVFESVQIVNVLGEEVYNTSVPTTELKTGLTPGMYLLQATRDNKQYVQRIVVE